MAAAVSLEWKWKKEWIKPKRQHQNNQTGNILHISILHIEVCYRREYVCMVNYNNNIYSELKNIYMFQEIKQIHDIKNPQYCKTNIILTVNNTFSCWKEPAATLKTERDEFIYHQSSLTASEDLTDQHYTRVSREIHHYCTGSDLRAGFWNILYHGHDELILYVRSISTNRKLHMPCHFTNWQIVVALIETFTKE